MAETTTHLNPLSGYPGAGAPLDIISKNPYRYLGVYSNSPTKARVANVGKMNAFLNVGKPVSFPLDLPNLLGAINRTKATVADAGTKLTLPADQVRYAQFWWMNASPLDGVAFNHLTSGNTTMAQAIWDKADNVSSLQNRLMLAAIRNDFAAVMQYAATLYVHFADAFKQQILGAAVGISTPLWQLFLDTLIDAGCNISAHIPVASWRDYVNAKTVGPLIDIISQAIAAAKSSRGQGSCARLHAGQNLVNDTRDPLSQLKKSLPPTDIRYQTIADKLAGEILQCSIDYYNDSDDDDCAVKAMKLQKAALSIAVGNVAKDRCKENVAILQKTIDSLPPAVVMPQYRAIMKELEKFCKLPDKISYAVELLNATKPHLQAMKKTLGATHPAYLECSTRVVGNALSNVIAEVNEAQEKFKLWSDLARSNQTLMQHGLDSLKEVLRKAWKATVLMDSFDMELEYKQNRYNENRRILKDICSSMGISTSASSPRSNSTATTRPSTTTTTRTSSTTSSSNESKETGCVWAIAPIFIVSIFGAGIGGVCGLFVGTLAGVVIGYGIYGIFKELKKL